MSPTCRTRRITGHTLRLAFASMLLLIAASGHADRPTTPDPIVAESLAASALLLLGGAAPSARQASAGGADTDSRRWWAAAALMALGSGLLLWFVRHINLRQQPRSSLAPTAANEYFPECYLVDLQGVTGSLTHALSNKFNMITRLQQPPQDGINYLQIFRRQIGRRHALLEYRDFSFWVIDQQSVNGTFLNGKRLMSETRLKHGDRLRFYKYEFEYCVSDLAFSNETLVAAQASRENTENTPR